VDRFLAVLVVLASVAIAGRADADEIEFLTGRFLVASDDMRDPSFAETVIYMLEHDEGGALGLIINKPAGRVSHGALLEGLGLEGKPAEGAVTVHRGGPVDPARGFVLHSADVVFESSTTLQEDLAVTTAPEIFLAIAEGKKPRDMIFALGYSGWAAGQLESELARGGWIHIEFDRELLFDIRDGGKWQRAIDLMKFDL